jgi:hypothetical protein
VQVDAGGGAGEGAVVGGGDLVEDGVGLVEAALGCEKSDGFGYELQAKDC